MIFGGPDCLTGNGSRKMRLALVGRVLSKFLSTHRNNSVNIRCRSCLGVPNEHSFVVVVCRPLDGVRSWIPGSSQVSRVKVPMKRFLFSVIVFLILAETMIQADVPGPSYRLRHPDSSGSFVILPGGTRHEIVNGRIGRIIPAPVRRNRLPERVQNTSREDQPEPPPPLWKPKSQIIPKRMKPPPRYPYALQVSLSDAEMAPPLDIASLFTEPDIWWSPIPADSTILADIGPGPSPRPRPFPAQQTTDPAPPESTELVDVPSEPA